MDEMERDDAVSSPSSHVIVIIINGTQSNKPLPYTRFPSFDVDVPTCYLIGATLKASILLEMKPGKFFLHTNFHLFIDSLKKTQIPPRNLYVRVDRIKCEEISHNSIKFFTRVGFF